ncbi:MAG: crotonase/enoyl-CoA hydratase family protein [Deltaproteobacteria bacterium]|nr:crotonase/enoyl-CoA hydratase family protein [Deltaproteobacteria bacterium]MBW1923047.1 crotonase/enoyl-CoA hydratase family protein [Deltaproteobacteria bacterium]MBW1949080.1 crotonase/enoyl-CoA hydratase family protein [Deltaproteobacteria bacterium]MBW2008244.1 crotonase/enoyl-CoA hydratase family protein [Deltaproteobacteria bacterium]MBW2347866.1 crotonase/enoyl-CoA hydratase family protein [Deltaproteobacteria bacterium]
MTERVTIRMSDGVADVRMNRPEKLNALDPEMFRALVEAGKALSEDAALRAVVLSGEGRAFCAGLDFQSFQALADTQKQGSAGDLFHRTPDSPANNAQLPAYIWTTLPVPVIAAVHGVAFGGGLQIAMGADIRFIAPDARMSVMEIKWGLVPDMSGTQTMRHLLPLDVLKELTFTGRIVSGVEAKELGLATHVSETPRESAMELAREIASKSPDAIRASKRLLNEAVLKSVEEGLRLEEALQKTLIGKPNQVEAVMANLEKRAPAFKDPQ